MGSTRGSVSHLWGMAMSKLFPRRASSSKRTDSQSSWCGVEKEHMEIEDCTDGFYKYSQELLEQEKIEELKLRSSNSTGGSFASALTEPTERPSLPYTVSAPDWNIYSSYLKYLNGLEDESVGEWLGSVLFVWVRVYTLSKVIVMVFIHYGVELEDIPDSVLAHVKRAEELVNSCSIADLVENTENLYYALYARLIMEIAAMHLCASFTLGFRRPEGDRSFQLPEPREICKTFLICKHILDEDNLCNHLNKDLVKEHQMGYIRYKMDKIQNEGFLLDDLLGYRRRALDMINDETSEFRQEWRKATPMYEMPPAEILTLQSEKYLIWTPRWDAVHKAVPALNLPFIDPKTIPSEVWQREMVLDQRQATLAKLESKCVGEIRRNDDRRRLIDLVRERKCICRPTCSCAWDCTQDVERPCPCSERTLSLMVAKRRKSVGPLPFGPRCNVLARAIFEGIASVRPNDSNDMDLCMELDRAISVFSEEVRKQRSAGVITNSQAMLSISEEKQNYC